MLGDIYYMPEGPEVALTAEILNKKLKNNILESIEFVSGRYGPGRTKPKGFNSFEKNLPLKLTKVDSKGKFMWFEIKNPESKWTIWNTFGLTGMWSFFKPQSERAVLTFKDGTQVYYSDQRNFGTFIFSDDPEELEAKLDELAPDFLKTDDIDFEQIQKINKSIDAILTDQKKIGSGIGNYLVAEILYRAKLSPHRLGSSLDENEIKRLEYWTGYTIKLAYDSNDIGYMVNLTEEASKFKRIDFHPDIKLKKQTEFKFQVYRQKMDPHGNKVTAEKRPNGRSIYWVKAVQK
jgi:formamidopyrimidine-DNA glycosylase